MKRSSRIWVLSRGWNVPTVVGGWLLLLIANLVGPKVVVLPAVAVSSQIPTPFVFLVGGLLAMLSLLLAGEPCPEVFVTSPAPARFANVSRVVIAALVGPVMLTTVGPGDLAATANTSMVVAGEGLLAAALLGLRLAWLPPLLHLAAAGSFGAATPDTLHPWAWLISATPSPPTVTFSAVLLTIGAAVWLGAMTRRASNVLV